MSKIAIELTPEKIKELCEDMRFISSFIGIIESLGKNVDMGEVCGSDILTLAEEAQSRACHIRDHLEPLKA